MVGIEVEFAIFLRALLAGAEALAVYELIRLFRRWIPHTLRFVSVEDFLFWFGVTLFMFIQIYRTSDGSIRWYFLLGVVVGAILAENVVFLLKKVGRKVKKGVDKSRQTD